MRTIDPDAVRQLVDQARTHVGRVSGRTPLRTALYRISRGRIDKRPHYNLGQLPRPNTPWRDTVSGRYFGWRSRHAYIDGGFVFAVEYVICQPCGIAYVDKPYTVDPCQRQGVASIALRVLREENPGLEWYTGSSHATHSRPFWARVGEGVAGGYRQRELCEHVTRR